MDLVLDEKLVFRNLNEKTDKDVLFYLSNQLFEQK